MVKPTNKVVNRCNIKQVSLLFFSPCCYNTNAQNRAENKYELLLIKKLHCCLSSVQTDSSKAMIANKRHSEYGFKEIEPE